MILATHGRALWILDHLEPIQEYAAAQAATADAKLFTPPPYGDVSGGRRAIATTSSGATRRSSARTRRRPR